MESELLTDKENDLPPVPLKTYQWEDLRRAREAGGYPWTHFLKPPLEGEITADDIIRETTPRRTMSREFSKSRTHSPADEEPQRILNLDSSPGSSRKHGEEGVVEGVHIPNFSKEVSLDSDDDPLRSIDASDKKIPESQTSSHLVTPVEKPKSVSPKGILKRRAHDQQYNIGVIETREKTKCCHPLVNKIKHLADKTLHKLEKNDCEKSPLSKRKKKEDNQEIRQLKSSPGAVRRQKFSAIKLGDSDEMSKTMCIDTPPQRKKKEHIYEDIEESKCQDDQTHLASENNRNENELESNNIKTENDNLEEKKSNTSQDPSLVVEEINNLDRNEPIMNILHKRNDRNKEMKDDMDTEEPNVDEIFQEQLEGNRPTNDSPNITITEITEDNLENNIEQSNTIPIESSPSPSPREFQNKRSDVDIVDNDWSKPNSDHEYEIIEKPPPNIVYSAPSVEERPTITKTDDELSSTTSIERKYLQHTSDEEDQADDKENEDKNEDIINAETLQKNIEERFFVNTPSTASRTECEISTSQVDSSALEKLPLQRSNRSKNSESADKKIQQRIKDGTGKLKSQAGKLKSKLQSMKTKQFTMPDRPKFNLPERPKFKMPERPKMNLPERPKFTLPDRRKFSLPERSKFKNFNFTEKFSIGDRKKFSFPNRPKFNVPDLSKIKMPERPKINFPSLGRKKENKVEADITESSSDIQNVATVDFEARTYPRLFNRKKKSELPKTSSSPTLNRDDTPPPTFTFTRVKKNNEESSPYIPDSPEHPREYGDVNNENGYESERDGRKQFETTYDFDKLSPEFMDEDLESSNLRESRNATSIPDMSLSKQEYTHINEINNDEFFVRPRGISRENIQVREYLSDEIRQAFQIPKNVLVSMGSSSEVHDEHFYANEPGEDPELMLVENEPIRYSSEDVNDGDDGYYTFPPVRPSRAKRNKKEIESIKYIDDSVNASMQFSEVDLELSEDRVEEQPLDTLDENVTNTNFHSEFTPTAELSSIHEYANDDVIEYPDNIPVQSQTLPMPPKRKKKIGKKDLKHSSLNDFKSITPTDLWDEHQEQRNDIIVYRTEHQYVVPHTGTALREQSPVPPRRNRSRSSRGTSLCDDDRTSHGAESLILDTHLPPVDDNDIDRVTRRESPGYATVDKTAYAPKKGNRRSQSKTPPARRRKSNSSERKYYTVGTNKSTIPNRPPRKKSSTSLMTLDSFTRQSANGDMTQYVEIEEPQFEDVHRDLVSGEVVKKMKDRPLPPPPRPPRGPKRKKKFNEELLQPIFTDTISTSRESIPHYIPDMKRAEDVAEIEVSTQTDPLPDDVDFEYGLDENLDISMSSSLRDIIDEESMVGRARRKVSESPRISRTTSRSEKSLKLSDPKISELSKLNIDRTSPTVILVEKRVSSPTKINEREEMLTEASLTVQHIDIEKSKVPAVPPLPRSKGVTTTAHSAYVISPSEDQAVEKISDGCRDVQLDNLVTQRLQVKDLDVGRLNVSELQANKILVSDIEGMTLKVSELDSKSGHISVSGLEFSQTVIDEIVKKFAEISTSQVPVLSNQEVITMPRPISREEHTQTEQMETEHMQTEYVQTDDVQTDRVQTDHVQTDDVPKDHVSIEKKKSVIETQHITTTNQNQEAPPPPRPSSGDEFTLPPQRPPLPDLSPLLYSYWQDLLPASTLAPRQFRERPFSDFKESQMNPSPPPPARRAKRKPAALQASDSSSGETRPRPSPRRMPLPVKSHEPTVTETGAQFLRACQNSISRTIRSIFNYFMSYIHGHEDKKDVQMALVIFLVLIAGLMMFGLSDSRTVHHHHWEFFNPPDGNQ